MVFHMKTTLNLDDGVLIKLKEEAARQGRTMSELLETALRLYFQRSREPRNLPPLPIWNFGGFSVDVDDRDALYEAMEGPVPHIP
jgi:hypothetical protein